LAEVLDSREWVKDDLIHAIFLRVPYILETTLIWDGDEKDREKKAIAL
jgi:hypothetical protein